MYDTARPVACGLLQRRAGRSSSFHTGTVPASAARSGRHRYGSQAAWRCDQLFRELHWLPVAERSQYKLCFLVHKSLLRHTPEYISDLLTSVANIPGRPTLRASSCGNLVVVPRTRRRIVDSLFLLLHREHGTGYRRSWNCCDRRTCFVVIWKHFVSFFLRAPRHGLTVMRPRSSSRGRNTSASVTVTVTVTSRLPTFLSALEIKGL